MTFVASHGNDFLFSDWIFDPHFESTGAEVCAPKAVVDITIGLKIASQMIPLNYLNRQAPSEKCLCVYIVVFLKDSF